MKAADDPLTNDPLLGRQLRSPEDNDPDVGTVISVVLKKPAGAKKKANWTRHYTVRWKDPDGAITLTREYQNVELTPFLV